MINKLSINLCSTSAADTSDKKLITFLYVADKLNIRQSNFKQQTEQTSSFWVNFSKRRLKSLLKPRIQPTHVNILKRNAYYYAESRRSKNRRLWHWFLAVWKTSSFESCRLMMQAIFSSTSTQIVKTNLNKKFNAIICWKLMQIL